MAQVNAKVSRPNRSMTKHPNLQNVSTTLGFGEVGCLGFVEMQGKTKVKGEIKSLIRTATMPVPTFGTISYQTYARFIPTTDVFRNNENLKGETPVTTQFGTFIPKAQPWIKVNALSAHILLKYCNLNAYYSNTEPTGFITQKRIKIRNLSVIDETDYSYLENYLIQYIGTPEMLNTDINNTTKDSRITPQNADFFIVRTPYDTIATTFTESWGNKKSIIYCARLTKQGKTLMRILTALGFKYNLRNDERCNILPFLAYYKGYFEIFQPKNTATGANVYTNTNAFVLSDYICEHDIQNVWTEEEEEGEYNYSLPTRYFINFIAELSKCYYYTKPNLITAHIATPSVGTQDYKLSLQKGENVLETNYTVRQKENGLATINSGNAYIVNAPSLKLLMKMYVISNKHSVIGGNLRKLIQSLYGYDPETLDGIVYDCGRQSYDLDITMIPSQADTINQGGAQLGEIGGLATGRSKDTGKNKNFKYVCKADTDGFLILYNVIVPNAGFFQGLDPRLKHGTDGPYSLYMEQFDSIGLEINTKSMLYGERLIDIPLTRIQSRQYSTDEITENKPFGFIPRFMSYKMLTGDIVNGDLRRNAYKEQLRAYYLGKEITQNRIEYTPGKDNTNAGDVDVFIENNIPVTTPELRSIGKYNWLENFNKIFYNYEDPKYSNTSDALTQWSEVYGYDDPFIIHNENMYNKFDHMKPTTESFETDGEENGAIDVEHA